MDGIAVQDRDLAQVAGNLLTRLSAMHAHEDGHFRHGSGSDSVHGNEQVVEVHDTEDGIGQVDGIKVHDRDSAQA